MLQEQIVIYFTSKR